MKFETGATYEGKTQNGLRHGKGKQIWPDGTSKKINNFLKRFFL